MTRPDDQSTEHLHGYARLSIDRQNECVNFDTLFYHTNRRRKSMRHKNSMQLCVRFSHRLFRPLREMKSSRWASGVTLPISECVINLLHDSLSPTELKRQSSGRFEGCLAECQTNHLPSACAGSPELQP